MFPTSYQSYGMPSYYQPFYRTDSDDYYRYANGYVYEIDRDTGLIEDIIPLLPGLWRRADAAAGYSAYNVPYQYRGALLRTRTTIITATRRARSTRSIRDPA